MFQTKLTIIVFQNKFNEKGLGLSIEEINNEQHFGKSEREIQTFETLEEINFLQDYISDFPIVNIEYILIENDDTNDHQVLAMFNCTREVTFSFL